MALRIAILGATGHIGRSLVNCLLVDKSRIVTAYARRPEAIKPGVEIRHTEEFGKHPFDVVINCIGVGDPARVRALGADIFQLTEDFDRRILDCLDRHNEALYINMSSGAVFGTSFETPVTADSRFPEVIDDDDPAEWYGMAKRRAEAAHRARSELNIVDIRVYSYFSRFIDLSGRLFIVDLVNAVRDRTVLRTQPDESIRDYATPLDLLQLIDRIISGWVLSPVNAALDLYSKAPVGKFELLDAISSAFDLRWEIVADAGVISSTGAKRVYYSENDVAGEWGYMPRFDSRDGVVHELSGLMKAPR